MSVPIQLSTDAKLVIAYHQFSIFDADVPNLNHIWQDAHLAQGFIRRDRSVGFAALLEWGSAVIQAFLGASDSPKEYERVIRVPLRIESGKLCIEGPEEFGAVDRFLVVEPASYYVTCAQSQNGEHSQIVDLFFEIIYPSETNLKSLVMVADPQLNPLPLLLEF